MEKELLVDNKLENLRQEFLSFRDPQVGEKLILEKLFPYETNLESYLAPWYGFSKESDSVYPSQGLLLTPHDYLDIANLQMLPQEELLETLRLRLFFLELFNHPYRMVFLNRITDEDFVPPGQISCLALESATRDGLSLSIGDLGASVKGGLKHRTSRTERYAQGPFVKLGRQARTMFVGSSSPDVWNSAAAIATMAASHCLVALPRNGLTSDVKRQTDLAVETFEWLENIEDLVLKGRGDREPVVKHWKNNVMGTLESSPEKAQERARALSKVGVRTFRVYSPEPGIGVVDTVNCLRDEFGDDVEIFAGQVISVDQAQKIEEAGADGLYVGIGGGGRCITGVRSGSVVDWPGLVWHLRGKTNLPVIAEGGASDHVAVSLLLGASAISVSRAVSGGTMESPGGVLFCTDRDGKLFKPYGGEASARTKYLDGKLLPFNIPAFVEGETSVAQMSYVPFVRPTLTYNLHLLIEDSILAMVFRNVNSLNELHSIDPSPLRRATSLDIAQRNVH